MSSRLSAKDIGTPREREILEAAANGFTDKEIAAKLGISRETVATYWKRIRLRLDGASRTEAVARALTIQKDAQLSRLNTEREELLVDLEERLAIGTELSLAVERLSVLLNNVCSGILFQDENRVIQHCNTAFCRLLRMDCDPEELVGLDCQRNCLEHSKKFLNPEEHELRIEEILSARQTVVGDQICLTDGTVLLRDYYPIEVSGSPAGHMWQFREPSCSPGS